MSWSIRKVPNKDEWTFHAVLKDVYNVKMRFLEGGYRYDQYGMPRLLSVAGRRDRESIMLNGTQVILQGSDIFPVLIIELPDESADALYDYIMGINERPNVHETYEFRHGTGNQLTEASYVSVNTAVRNNTANNAHENNNPTSNENNTTNNNANNNPKPVGGKRKYKTRKVSRRQRR